VPTALAPVTVRNSLRFNIFPPQVLLLIHAKVAFKPP
jgi:hypothetical protein